MTNKVLWRGNLVPEQDAVELQLDFDCFGSAFVEILEDGSGRRVKPESIRVLRKKNEDIQ